MKTASLVATVGSLVLPLAVSVAQPAHRFGVLAVGGFGPSSSSGVYEGSFNLAARLEGSFALSPHTGIEVGAHIVNGGAFQGDLGCDVGNSTCAYNYQVSGVFAGIGLEAGSNAHPSPFRFGLGAGAYRVQASGVQTRTTLGVHAGFEMRPWQWKWGAIVLGFRVIALPDVQDAHLWLVPFEIGLRVR